MAEDRAPVVSCLNQLLGLDLGQRTKLQQRRPLRPLRTEGALKKLRETLRQLPYSAVKIRAVSQKLNFD